MDEYDIGAWVEQETDPARKDFRAAVHTVLYAIANSPLQAEMVIKGGILLAFRYKSRRFTKDVDFSTSAKFSGFDQERFRASLETALAVAVESLDYGLDCRVQSMEVKPRKKGATFPTLSVSLGYARKGDRRTHKRLLALNSSDIVKIDYSFNEITDEIECVQLSNGGEISAYSLTDLIAEKYRAILQQEVRKRVRRQDAYDLFFLFENYPVDVPEDKTKILSSFRAKAASRGLVVNRKSMKQEEIERRSREDYQRLAQEIPGPLPPFEKVYAAVQAFYESLPWEEGR